MGYIYLVTNKIDKKQYVGQTVCDDIKNRWRQHKAKSGIGKYLLSAYNKYGVDNFTYRIICICFDEDCNKYEAEYIKKYKTLAPNGYNLETGGKRSYKTHNEEVLKKMSEKLKGVNHPNYGKKLTDEQKKFHSERMKGSNNPNYGKKISEEQKEKMRKAMTGRKISEEAKNKLKKPMSEETRNKISKAMTGKKREPLSEETKQKIREKSIIYLTKYHNDKKKQVAKYDLNNNLIETYSSLTEACEKNNLKRTTLTRRCHNPNDNKPLNNYIYKFTS